MKKSLETTDVRPRLRVGLKLLLAGSLSCASANAESVDTELVLLVDVSGSTNRAEFLAQRSAYADVFRSADVLDAIHQGCGKSVAVTLVYWAGAGQQATAVDWMKIDDAASANLFADAISATTAPFTGRTALGEAVTHASGLFGDETGGVSNGFESSYQMIHVTGNGVDNATAPRRRDRQLNVAEARDGALASGVDMINGIPITSSASDLGAYYEDFVIGGSIEGTAAFSHAVDDIENLTPVLKDQLVNGFSAVECVHTVPEPASTLMLAVGMVGFCWRRNKK